MPRRRSRSIVGWTALVGLAVLAVSACEASPSPFPTGTASASGAAARSAMPDDAAPPNLVALLVRIRDAHTQGFAFIRDLGQAPSDNATATVLARVAAWADIERGWIAGNAVPACGTAAQAAYLEAVNNVASAMGQFRALFRASPRPPDAAFGPSLQAFSDAMNAFQAADALTAAAVRTCRG